MRSSSTGCLLPPPGLHLTRRMAHLALLPLPLLVLLPLLLLPLAAVSQTRDAADEWRYRVVAGDTLIGISTTYLANPADWVRLQQLNRVKEPKQLAPGSILRIPLGLISRSATVAELVFVRGDVSVQRGPSSPPETVASGAVVRVGDVVRTAAEASATVRFADGSRMSIAPVSEIGIAQSLALGKPGVPSVRLDLRQGSAEVQVPPTDTAGRRFEVRTPSVNLGVRGTEFRAHFDPARSQTRLEVLQGRVAVELERGRRGAGALRSVDGGFGWLAEPGKPAPLLLALVAAPDLSGLAERVERLPLRLNWREAPGAAGYRVQVAVQDQPDHLLLDGVFDTATAGWTDLPDGRYLLRVRAFGSDALEGLNAERRFVVKARPEPPFTIAPRQGADTWGDTASFAWTGADQAQRYRLQISADDDFSNSLVDRSDITTSRHVQALPPGNYRWRVASIGAGDDQGPFGDAQPFRQRDAPAAPAIEAPRAGAAGIVLRWAVPVEGQTVRYQIATDAAFEHVVVDQTTGSAEGLLPQPSPGRYFVRAQVITADGFEGAFGATQHVDVRPSAWWLLLPLGMILLVV